MAEATLRRGQNVEVDSGTSVRALMWRKFMRNRAAAISGVVLIVLYTITLFAGFFAPYSAHSAESSYSFGPPTPVRFYDSEAKRFYLRPFIYPVKSERDAATFQLVYQADRSERVPLIFFVEGERL